MERYSRAKTYLAGSALLLAMLGPALPLQGLVTLHRAERMHLQEEHAGAPLGKLNVPQKTMAGLCITQVSPEFPQSAGAPLKAASVIVRVVVWKSGAVTPMRTVSGPPALEQEAMNAVRLWKYRAFVRDGEAIDVTTDVTVDFDPQKPAGTVTHPNL